MACACSRGQKNVKFSSGVELGKRGDSRDEMQKIKLLVRFKKDQKKHSP